MTLIIHFVRGFETGDMKANWVIWAGLSWNYFAYAFDKRMLPWQFVELKGDGKGDATNRTFFFWGTLAIHLSFLAVMAFANT